MVTRLARRLRITDYFSLGWGTMVGVGWLVVMDDWLLRGGPLGGILGFAIGGVLLLPIGFVYGKWVMAMPDAAGEVAYTAKVFPRAVSFYTGWMMMLAYFIVCPWEAVAVGRLAGFIFLPLNGIVLYSVAGQAGVPAAPRHWARPYCAGDGRQLSRHSAERNISELDDLRNTAPFCHLCRPGRCARLHSQLSAIVHAYSTGLNSARAADCSVFHDRFRIRDQGCRGSQS